VEGYIIAVKPSSDGQEQKKKKKEKEEAVGFHNLLQGHTSSDLTTSHLKMPRLPIWLPWGLTETPAL
jgi:hypothetical protein